VLKPSEKDPSASLLLARLLKEAGLPDGVFNVVHGDKVAVDALLTHPRVDAGYGSTGQRCMAVSAVVAVGAAGDQLIEKVRERLAVLRVGPGSDPEAQ